jgi:hypothetical protein
MANSHSVPFDGFALMAACDAAEQAGAPPDAVHELRIMVQAKVEFLRRLAGGDRVGYTEFRSGNFSAYLSPIQQWPKGPEPAEPSEPDEPDLPPDDDDDDDDDDFSGDLQRRLNPFPGRR